MLEAPCWAIIAYMEFPVYLQSMCVKLSSTVTYNGNKTDYLQNNVNPYNISAISRQLAIVNKINYWLDWTQNLNVLTILERRVFWKYKQ